MSLNIKKTNYLLIIITLICSLITIISEIDKGIIIIIKDASIIITLTIPYILKKIFNLNLKEKHITIWIVFIFLAHYLGVTAEYYNKWNAFDKIIHTMSGIISALIASIIIEKEKITNSKFNIIFIISFSMMCAGMWEIFEFTCDNLFGYDAQLVKTTGVKDTMGDIIVALIGSIIYSMFYKVKTL